MTGWGVLTWVLACSAPSSDLPDGAPGRIVLVSMDTLRYDATGPAFAGLEGTRFTSAVAPAPTTLASHTSLFTGLYPHHHGVPRNEYGVPDELETLPERLKAKGYRTGAFLGAMPLGPHTGFPQGFDHVDDRFTSARGGVSEQTERPGTEVTDGALAWIGEQEGPLFAFVHYYDAHEPWVTPVGGVEPAHMDEIYQARAGRSERPRELERLYRTEAAAVDRELGRLIAGLGTLDDTWLIVTADHGETLDRHPGERFDHGNRVYDETVHVPLVFAGEGWATTERTEPVSLVDVLPTLMARMGEVVAGDGVDLAKRRTGPVFTEATKPFRPGEGWINAPRWKAVRSGQDKVHWDPESGVWWQFDLAKDPGEATPGLASDALKKTLTDWASDADPLPTEKVSDAQALEQLKSLGYLD